MTASTGVTARPAYSRVPSGYQAPTGLCSSTPGIQQHSTCPSQPLSTQQAQAALHQAVYRAAGSCVLHWRPKPKQGPGSAKAHLPR